MKRITGLEAIQKGREVLNNSDSALLLAIRFPDSSIDIYHLYGCYFEMKINTILKEYVFMEITKTMAELLIDNAKCLINDDIIQVKIGGF